LLAAFVLWSVNETYPEQFPIELDREFYEFLVTEKFPINESRLSRQLRGIPEDPTQSTGGNYLVCEPTEAMEIEHREPALESPEVKAIAFYLPQFHRIPENDKWWGDGFTEWTYVKRARPFFRGHNQPRVPADLGYYDLTDAEVRLKQAELAQRYGIYGFCYYHYRFGTKRLLEMPFSEVLKSAVPSLPFCLCWANENWTRRWDGLDQEILIAQNYSFENDRAFLEELIPAFEDSRYIKIDGRPLLIVYQPGDIPKPADTFAVWRRIAKASGFPELYIAGVHTFGWFGDPREHGMDAAIEFPIHFWVQASGKGEMCDIEQVDPKFNGDIKSYYLFKTCSTSRPRPSYTLFKGVMPMWDNTARRMEKATLLHTSNLVPESYHGWLRHVVDYTHRNLKGDERLIFINAWNEWGEGCYLEPDQTHGRALLRATRLALNTKKIADSPNRDIRQVASRRRDDLEIVFVSHDAFRAGAQRLLLALVKWLAETLGVRPKIILRRGGVLERDFAQLGPILRIESVSEPMLSTEVKRFIGNSASLVYVNTLVPGEIAAIAAELGVPVITHVHELENAIQRWCDKDLLNRILKVTDHFIAAAEPVAHNLIRQHGIEPDRVTVVNEFIECSYGDASHVDKVRLRHELHLAEREFIVFGCGTTDWRKGPDLFVDVAREVKELGKEDMHFYWIGGGTVEERQLLEARIRSCGLKGRVDMLGEVTEPRTYFQSGDVFLLTSREDPFPLVCLEAADCGLPIVCFGGVGGMPDFVGDDVGFVVPFGNTKSMAENLIFLSANAQVKDQLGARAHEKVRRENDVSHAAPKILETIQFVCERVSRGARLSDAKAPTVSIIVPNYNHASFLGCRLDSIVHQEFVDYEVIVLDDASTDNSREIMDCYRKDHQFRFIFNDQNSGSAFKQWQKGLNEARGEYIWFAESDDYAAPAFLSKLVSVLEANPSVGLVYCQSNLVDRNNVILGDACDWTDDLDRLRWRQDFFNEGRAEIRDFLSKKNTIPNASAVLLRSSVLKTIGDIDGSFKLCGDWFLWVQVLFHSNIAYVADRLNFWRQASSNSRICPPGVLEWEEGQRVLGYLSRELKLSDSETNEVLSAFSQRCRRWLKDSAGVNPDIGLIGMD
jgi:glycosyltransferase involved in cell wall biosynthesis